MSVDKDRQGKGIGRGLMNQARQWAAGQDLPAITLTTFRDVPWNDRFCASMGFSALSTSELTQALSNYKFVATDQIPIRGLTPPGLYWSILGVQYQVAVGTRAGGYI
ncbi:Uncharacterized protein TPAR_01297 [Tolypocladium paradoxum]|uniref:N-acetyltransferase domain-containing protein n=1 Tax=Tolypocladium paradoxum TaxID=94208 RepID=A0A2S4L7V6_9HYPO|nr:Uncharacterized protein TPAR_01297 [Tolypocladium paradoxum]